MAHVSATGTIFLGKPKNARDQIAFFPSLFQKKSGELYCVFQIGRSKNCADAELGLCVSPAGLDGWERLPNIPAPAFDGRVGSLCIGALTETDRGHLQIYATWYDRTDPARPLFDPETEGILHSKLLTAESGDGGRSWKPWRHVQTGTVTGCALTGPTLNWPDGSRAVALESFKHFDETEEKFHAAWICPSDNHPKTAELQYVAGDPSGTLCYWDQRLTPLGAGGDFLALFWTHDRSLQRDLPVHVKKGHWRKPDFRRPASTQIPGQIAAPLALSETHILALVVDRNGAEPGINLHQSTDAGETWNSSPTLTVYRHRETAVLTQGATEIDFAQYWEDMGKWSFGHPGLLRLDERNVLAAYYAGTPNHMGIRYANITL